MAMLKEGDRIPDFTVLDQDGNTVTRKDFEGKKIGNFLKSPVVYHLP